MTTKANIAIDALLDLEPDIRAQLCGGNALDAVLDALRSIHYCECDDETADDVAQHERALERNPGY